MPKTLLIGLDGATFSILDPLIDSGLMPQLREFVNRGARAKLRSTIPAHTPAAWTSMVTGRKPCSHGVFEFIRVLHFDQYTQYRLATSSDVRCETIWSIASRQDLRPICLNFPVMIPPKPLKNGYVLPGFVPQRHLRRHVYPPNLYERLIALPGFDVKKLTFDLDQERRAVQVLPKDQCEAWIHFHIEREIQWFNILRHLMETEPWDLVGWIADGFDKLGHACWRFMDPQLRASSPSPWEHNIQTLCLDYFRTVDRILGELFAIAGTDAAIFLTSDHGFTGSDEIFYVNVWLEQHGYLKWLNDVPFAEEGMVNTEGSKSVTYMLDWSLTHACAMTAGGNGIYIRVAQKPGQFGIQPERYDALRTEIKEGLLAVRNPETGQCVVEQVLTREEAFGANCTGLPPDLTLVLRDHGFVSVLRSEVVVKSRREIVGTHHPYGIFIAAGSGIKQGVQIETLSILDVAPAVLYSLGLPVPIDIEGRFPSEIFEPGVVAASPCIRDGITISVASDNQTVDVETEAIIFDRLRKLGYMA
jgi:predicted AlkP superfamily phosphohydrolase/phosphomutase